MPESFEDLTSFIGTATRESAPNGNPVLVVNSDKDIDQEDLDFNKRDTGGFLLEEISLLEDLP